MASTLVTRKAPDCADCGLVTVPRSAPGAVLDRLPATLFNLARPTAEDTPGALFDAATFDHDVFDGLPGSDDATPQYELARVIAREKDAFLFGWRTAEALQLGLGAMIVTEDGVVGESPRAAGADLDRVGEQYGIGRPQGFTDCCYWRLIRLLLFTPGPTLWRLLEIAELYTGVRPAVTEAPARITLTWPASSAGTHYAAAVQDGGPEQGAYNVSGIYAGDASPVSAADGAWNSGPRLGASASAWQSTARTRATGLSLLQALRIAKSAGVFIALVNPPRLGAAGCAGATTRGPASGSGLWAQATEGGV